MHLRAMAQIVESQKFIGFFNVLCKIYDFILGSNI